MNIQGWLPLGLTDLIFLLSNGLSRIFSTPQFESINSLALSLLYGPSLLHLYMTTGKAIALTRWTFVGKVMSLLFKMLSRLVIAFLPRSKHLLISWLQSPSSVILEPKLLCVKATQSCWILCDPMDYTVRGTVQARIREWVAFPFSRGSSQPRN